jgi:hypothetical protein
VCQKCIEKISDYDNFQTKANQLKDELINQIKVSQNSLKTSQESLIETFDENFQLNEDFPEIEFDFDLKSCNQSFRSSSQKPSEISPNFREVIEKEGFKYDLETFHKAFGDVGPCESPQLQVSSVNSFELEIQKTQKKQKFVCSVCGTSFKAESSLKVHEATNCENKKENLLCYVETCKKTFKDKISLRAHLICHKKDDKDPAFFCDQCGKSFFYKLSFTQHQKIHSGIRDKQCEVCGFKAISTTHLQRHIRARHTKEKNHVCTFCFRAFSER